MLYIILDMIKKAQEQKNYDILDDIDKLIDMFAATVNCPSNWRDIGGELTKSYRDGIIEQWVYDYLNLSDYDNYDYDEEEYFDTFDYE